MEAEGIGIEVIAIGDSGEATAVLEDLETSRAQGLPADQQHPLQLRSQLKKNGSPQPEYRYTMFLLGPQLGMTFRMVQSIVAQESLVHSVGDWSALYSAWILRGSISCWLCICRR